MTALVEVVGLRIGAPPVPLVDGFELRVEPGELVALVGPSLTGKTALLAMLAGWTSPAAGTVRWAGEEGAPPWSTLTVVPQEIALIEELTVGENVSLAGGRRSGVAPDDDVVSRLDIGHLWERGGYEISVGERQRTMVARALVGSPAIVLADEPVAHQDALRAETILALLRERAEAGAACILATRDIEHAAGVDRVLEAPF